MNHRPGLDRLQTLLFPERLEDYIAAENPVRFLDAFVGSLDLHALGFGKARCANTGRPPYAPAGLPLRLSAPGGGADTATTGEVPVTEDAGGTSVWDHLPRRSLGRRRVKRYFGYTHFLLKGLTKVRTEWSLTTLVYNLKRVLNLVRFQKLMAAVA